MELNILTAISPIDGRYRNKTNELSAYFSEFGLIKYRLIIEIEYFIKLCDIPLPQLTSCKKDQYDKIRSIYRNFNTQDAQRVKEIEKKTNHDVKAIEYFLKEKFDQLELKSVKEFIHFGLTSQDINNTAVPLSIKDCMNEIYNPLIESVLEKIDLLAETWKNVPILARTHGQPASPSRLGKEIKVFSNRIQQQLELLKSVPYSAKFGGATGNFNAHHVSYPTIDWINFGNDFVNNTLGLKRSQVTTQIEHYDNLGALCDNLKRINTILINLCRDMWTYISIEYFKQKVIKDEVGSSAMPHKVNPIDFENAEGNFGFANAIFEHLSAKLPISRLQRDLTDSTVLRNIGVPFAHSIIAFQSLLKGLDKISLNTDALNKDLENNWMVIAEAIQTILRREGYPEPYEALKDLTRNNNKIDKDCMHSFIDSLSINDTIKNELKKITPQNYTGILTF